MFGVDADGGTITDEHSMQKVMRRKAAQNLDAVGLIPVHSYASLMGTTSAGGASRPLYRGVFMVGGYDEGYFSPTWVAA
jgi:hypothetical protein